MGYAFYAGKLRERVTIRRRVETKNDGGGLDLAWSTLADEVPAEIVSMDGREALVGNVLQGVTHYQVTTRFREDVLPSDQILWRGREYNIRSAADALGTRQWMRMLVTNEAPQGA